MSATIRKFIRNASGCVKWRSTEGRRQRAGTGAVLLACLFLASPAHSAPGTGAGATAVADQPTTNSGRAAAAHSDNATRGSSPAELLLRDLEARTPTASELLSPGSRAWSGAAALSLRLARPEVLLAEGVIAAAGNGEFAAAARPDGSILLFAPGNGSRPRTLSMPGGHPAFALGHSADGRVLAAWSQGTGEVVFFDLASGSAEDQARPLRLAAPLSGEVMLTLSADGQILVAHDGSGSLWAGMRGGEMRPLGVLAGKPAMLAFSPGGGVLVSVDRSGAGQVWNPRTGKRLRSFTVPGGPFLRGDVVSGPDQQGGLGQRLRLWSEAGALVRWDLLRGEVADEIQDAAEGQEHQPAAGLLQLRGPGLFFVGEGRTWSAAPDYEPQALSLSWSREQRCLRLQDLDGVVRYYSSESGAPRPQCFAVDWSPVEIRPDGGAAVPGLALRVYDRLGPGPSGSQINVRAVSGRDVRLWTADAAASDRERQGRDGTSATASQNIADQPQLAVPLRGGLADQPATRILHLGR